MNTVSVEAILPGEYICDELEARDWTPADFARITRWSMTTVNSVLDGSREIDTEIAQVLAATFGTSFELWLGLQNAYNASRQMCPCSLAPVS